MASLINADTADGLKISSDLTGEVEIQSDGTTVLDTTSSGVAVTGTLSASGNITSTSGNITASSGTITANTFVGDGSSLTGISSYTNSDALTLFNASGSAPVYACRAWVSWDGGATAVSTIFGSGNVSSVTDNGTGQSTINFTTALPNANYAVVGMATGYSNLCNENMVIQSADGSNDQNPTTKTTSAVRVAYGHANTAGLAHIGYLTVAIFG